MTNVEHFPDYRVKATILTALLAQVFIQHSYEIKQSFYAMRIQLYIELIKGMIHTRGLSIVSKP